MATHILYVSTDNEMATSEEVANSLHALVADANKLDEATFTEVDFIVSVDANKPPE